MPNGGIDTIHMTYNFKDLGGSKVDVIDALYTKTEEWHYDENGKMKYTNWKGTCISPEYNREFNLYVNDDKFTMYGSINKFIKGNNFEGITQEELNKSITNLSEVMGCDLMKADVTRLDFANNYSVENNPKAYYLFMGSSHQFKRLEQESTITYKGTRGTSRHKLLYDKGLWARHTNGVIPEEFEGKHILRFENRITGSNQINYVINEGKPTQHKTTVKEAISNNGLHAQWNDWRNQYFAIKKQNNFKYAIQMNENPTPSEAKDMLLVSQLQANGEDSLTQYFEYLKQDNVFGKDQTGRQKLYRFKKDINEKIDKYRITNDLIDELDSKISHQGIV